MSYTIGALEIELIAGVARLQKDMEQAKRSVSGAMSAIEKSVGVAKSALTGLAGGLAAGLSVGAFSAWIKGAVDAADAASKLSQRAGVAVKDIAGLQLAYQQAGLDTNVLAESTAKLAKGMADGNKALKAMGIQSKDAAGNFKSTTAVLYEVADAFEGMPNSIQKTALAVTLFGESGSKLLPLLNGGSEGMREMAEMAEKLGLTISEETARDAEAFNDTLELVGMGSRGVANGIAAQLLPTLSSLAGSFLESMTSGDKLKNTADFLASGLKILYTVGVGVVEVFSTIGKTIGAAGAQIVAILSGDFKLAAQIGREWSADMKNGWSDTAKAIAKAWDSSGNSVVESQAKLIAANRDYLGDLKKREEAEKAAAEAAKKRAKEISDAEEKALKESIRRAEEGRKAAEAILKSYNDEAKRSIENAIKEAEQNERLAETFGMTKTQIEALELARLEEQLAQRSSLGLTLQEIETLEKLIEAKRRSVSAVGKYEEKDAARKAAEESAKEWQKSFDQISQSLTDAIMRGGKSAGEYLKDYFRTLVLKPIVQAIMNPIAGAVTSMLSGGGGGGLLGSLSQGAGLVNAGSTLWSAFSGGLSSGIGGAISSAGGFLGSSALSSFGAGMKGATLAPGLMGPTTAGAGGAMGAGATFSAALPWIAGAVALASVWKKAFGRGPKEVTSGGFQGVFGTGGFEEGLNFQRWQQKGGWFRSDREGTDYSAMDSEFAMMLSDTFNVLKMSTVDLAKSLGLSADSISTYAKGIVQDLTGDQAKDAEIIAGIFKDIGNEMATSILPNFADFAKKGEEASAVLQRLAIEYQAVDAVMTTLGITFGQVGIASAAARSRLVELVGGVDALAAGAAFFAENFLSEEQRLAPIQKAVADEMARLGYAGIKTHEQFRDLVLGIDKTTESGAKLYADLMRVQGAFDAVADAAKVAGEAAKAEADAAAKARLDRTMTAVNTAYSILQRSVQAQKDVVTEAFNESMESMRASLDIVNSRIGRFSALSSTLRSTLDRMLLPQQFASDRAAASAQISAALAIARASGILPDADALRPALDIVSQPAEQLYTSFVDYQRAFQLQKNDITALANISDDQLTTEQQTLAALNEQIKIAESGYSAEMLRLDGILESAQTQIDVLSGIDTSIMSLTDAIAAMSSAIAGALAAGASGGGANSTIFGGAGYGGTGGYGGAGNGQGATAELSAVERLYADFSDMSYLTPEGGAYWASRFNAGASLAQIEKEFQDSVKAVRGFAGGGWHSGGLRIVGERGAEIEATGPARYYSATQTAQMLGGGTSDVLLKELIDENRKLRGIVESHLYAIAKSNRDAADVLTDAADGKRGLAVKTISGEPIQTEAA